MSLKFCTFLILLILGISSPGPCNIIIITIITKILIIITDIAIIVKNHQLVSTTAITYSGFVIIVVIVFDISSILAIISSADSSTLIALI